jgi:hypothetical protein
MRIRNPGWKNSTPGWKKFGSGMEKSRIRDPESGKTSRIRNTVAGDMDPRDSIIESGSRKAKRNPYKEKEKEKIHVF